MKPPSVNKDDLIWALKDNSSWTNYYLDLETGDIISTSTLEETEIDEEDLDSDRYYYIDPMLPWEAYNFMVSFIQTVKDEEIKRRLSIAIDGREAFRMFKATLQDYPEEEKRWFQYHDKKMNTLMNGLPG